MIQKYAYIMLFVDDVAHPLSILLATAEASLGVLNQIGYA
jgi:hypothetical protein